jgi:NTP pyrophosphatase (non-canonical NTP hydrolase)
MVDEESPMLDLIGEAHGCAIEKGWWDGGAQDRTDRAEADFPALLALIHSEVSEALEAYRKPEQGYPDGDAWGWIGPNGKPEGILSELADVVIRIFDLVGALGMGSRFASVLVAKMRYNRTRPHRHGGKRC